MTAKLGNLPLQFLLVAAAFLTAACNSNEQAAASSRTATPVTSLLAVQENAQQAESIQIIGLVESMTDGIIVVNGLMVNTAGAGIDGALAAGTTVQVQGTQSPEGAVTAEYVWVLESTPAPTATAEGESGIIPFVIEGPVQALSGNRIRIHGFDLELDDDPRLQALQVGDVLRIGGEVDDDRLDDLFDDGIDDDIDDDRYVTVRNTQFGFLSNEIYASDDGQVWRDSGSCVDAPPGWATASAWRARCSGEYGGGPPATGASNPSGGDGSSSSGNAAPPPPPAGGDGNSNSGNDGGAPPPPPAGGDGSSSSASGGSNPPPPPPPPPPPAGGDGDSSSGSSSGSGS